MEDNKEMLSTGLLIGAVVGGIVGQAMRPNKPKTLGEKAQAQANILRETLGEQYDSATDYVQSASKKTGKQLRTEAKQIKKAAKRSKRGLASIVDDGLGLLEDVMNTVQTSAGDTAENASDSVKTSWRKGRKKAASAAEDLQDTVSTMAEDANDNVKTSWLRGRKKAEEFAEDASDGLSSATKEAAFAGTAFTAAATDTTGDVIRRVIDFLQDSLHTTRERAEPAAQEAAKRVRQAAADAPDTMRTVAQDVGGRAREVYDDVRDRGPDAVRSAAQSVGERAREVYDDVRHHGPDVVRSAAQNVGEKGREVKSVVVPVVAAAAATVGAKARSTAHDVEQAVAPTVRAATENVNQAAHNVSESAQEVAQSIAAKTGEITLEASRKGRRARTGLRSFLIGAAVGLLTTPLAGEDVRRDLRAMLEKAVDRVLVPTTP